MRPTAAWRAPYGISGMTLCASGAAVWPRVACFETMPGSCRRRLLLIVPVWERAHSFFTKSIELGDITTFVSCCWLPCLRCMGQEVYWRMGCTVLHLGQDFESGELPCFEGFLGCPVATRRVSRRHAGAS